MPLCHEYVCGITRSGKTTYAVRRIERLAAQLKGRILFFDTKGDTQCSWAKVGRLNSWSDIRAERYVRYVPSPDLAQARLELSLITIYLLREARRGLKWVLGVDEVQMFAPQGTTSGSCHTIATQGLGLGIVGVFVSQSAADTAKTVLRQCDRIVVFRQDSIWEAKYWKGRIGDAWQTIQTGTQAPYSYMVLQNGKMSGPYRENLQENLACTSKLAV